MPVQISGVLVATVDDLRRMEARIDAVAARITKVEREARAQSEDNAGKIRVVQSDLKVQQARADRIEADVRGLSQALEAIAKEAERSSTLLDAANASLAQSGSALEQLAALAGTQSQAGAERHQGLTAQLEHLLTLQQQESVALHEAFAGLQTGVTGLAQAEQDGSKQVERSIRVLRESIVQAQSQVQDELTQMAAAIQGYAQAGQAQAGQEGASLEGLLVMQERLGEHLQAIQAITAGLAESGTTAQAWQEARLQQTAARRAHELNGQAAVLLHRGEYGAAALLLEDACGLAPQSVAIRTNLALACLRSGQVERAEQLLRQVTGTDAQAVGALNELGVLYLEQGNPQSALPPLCRAAELAPDEAAIWLNLGRAHYACGAVAQALAAWQRAHELEPLLVAGDAEVRIALEEQAQIALRGAA